MSPTVLAGVVRSVLFSESVAVSKTVASGRLERRHGVLVDRSHRQLGVAPRTRTAAPRRARIHRARRGPDPAFRARALPPTKARLPRRARGGYQPVTFASHNVATAAHGSVRSRRLAEHHPEIPGDHLAQPRHPQQVPRHGRQVARPLVQHLQVRSRPRPAHARRAPTRRTCSRRRRSSAGARACARSAERPGARRGSATARSRARPTGPARSCRTAPRSPPGRTTRAIWSATAP